MVEPQGVVLRRSQRERKYAILDEYVVSLQESDFDIRSSKIQFRFHKPWKVLILLNE
jgi:hypothetical protein